MNVVVDAPRQVGESDFKGFRKQIGELLGEGARRRGARRWDNFRMEGWARIELRGSSRSVVKARAAILAGLLVVAVAGLVWFGMRTSPAADSAAPRSTPVPLEVQTCEEAKAYPQLVRPEDVRFVECDRNETPDAEAFKLGNPIVIPSTPPSIDAVEYEPEKCPNNGGGITTYSVRYRPENVDAAIECSKHRCDSGDAIGCEDLGLLHSNDNLGGLFPALRPDAAKSDAAFKRGCELGGAGSCLNLASVHEKKDEIDEATRYYELACRAPVPFPQACLESAERLISVGKDDEAFPYLVLGCRGTAASSNPYLFGDRQGCAILARRARLRGDLASYQEYLRLECAFGRSERTLAACEELGLLLLGNGFTMKAAAYLRKACGTDARIQALYHRACAALRQIATPNSRDNERRETSPFGMDRAKPGHCHAVPLST